jgi:hypothetical protein
MTEPGSTETASDLRQQIIDELELDLSKQEDVSTLEKMLEAATASGKVLGKDVKEAPTGAVYSGAGTTEHTQGAQKIFKPEGVDYVRAVNKAKTGS